MINGGLSRTRLARMHVTMAGHVERGEIPGMVLLVSRRGEVQVDAIGTLGADGGPPMRRDTVFRISSMTKPVAAAAAMMLVEECRLRLDDPVDRLLPELADRRVLVDPAGPLDDTIPAERPITLRDLLTLRMGFGYPMTPGPHPIMDAANAVGLLLGPPQPQAQPAPDVWMRNLGTLPLMAQPGTRFMYDVSADVLGVLVARASGQSFDAFLKERVFDPLGMRDTGFVVPPGSIARLPTAYEPDPSSGTLRARDPADGGQWSRMPAFPSASAGLVSTVDDVLAFQRMLLAKGRHVRERILSRAAVELMTTDHLPADLPADARVILGDHRGWGFGMGVVRSRAGIGPSVGAFGWDGGLGTSAMADPREDLVAILMTQVAWTSPSPPTVWHDFWTSVYQSIDD